MNDENIFTYSLSADGKIEAVKAETIDISKHQAQRVADQGRSDVIVYRRSCG